MTSLETWSDSIANSFTDLWDSAIGSLPTVVGAIIIILVGSIVSKGISMLIQNLLREVWTKQLAKTGMRSVFGAEEAMQKGGWKINVPSTISSLVYWFLMIVFLMAATEILHLEQVTRFLNSVLLYLPNVIVAVVILLVGVVISELVSHLVSNAVGLTKVASAKFLSSVARWSIMVFAFMAALVQLGVAASLIQILFTGFVAMLALAGGLAFGLGGKDHANTILNDLRRDLTNKE